MKLTDMIVPGEFDTDWWVDRVATGLKRWGFPELADKPGSPRRRARMMQLIESYSEDQRLERLIREAEAGDEKPLQMWLSEFVIQGDPVPEAFRRYVADVLTGSRKRKRGRDIFANFDRDFAIGAFINIWRGPALLRRATVGVATRTGARARVRSSSVLFRRLARDTLRNPQWRRCGTGIRKPGAPRPNETADLFGTTF